MFNADQGSTSRHLTTNPKCTPTISSVSACDNTRMNLALLMLHHAAPRRRLPRGRPTPLHARTVVRSPWTVRNSCSRSTTSCAGGKTPESRKLKAVCLIQNVSVMAGVLLIMPGSTTACTLLRCVCCAGCAEGGQPRDRRQAAAAGAGLVGHSTTWSSTWTKQIAAKTRSFLVQMMSSARG